MDAPNFGISFKFSKESRKKKLLVDEPEKDVDFVYGVDRQGIKSVIPKEKPKEYIIPLPEIKKKNGGIPLKISSLAKKNNDSSRKIENVTDIENASPSSKKPRSECTVENFDKDVVNALLEDVRKQQEKWAYRATSEPNFVIPLNQEHVEESTMDFEDVVEDADYDNAPINGFGVALLRGMGWKKGQGIGRKHASAPCKLKEVQLRPKGLGIGATRSDGKHVEGEKAIADVLKVGSFCEVVLGRHIGQLGLVDSLEGDAERVVLRTEKEVLSLSVGVVRCLSRAEYDRKKKYLNHAKYEAYKQAEETKKISDSSMQASKSENSRNDGVHKKKSRKEIEIVVSSPRRSSFRKNSSPVKTSKEATESIPWLRSYLCVRFVDESYMQGLYFRQKLKISEVIEPKVCNLITNDGLSLTDIKQRQLETVVPKEGGLVMVVKGSLRGQIGRVIKRDKHLHMTQVQLVQDLDVLSLHYDDICECSSDSLCDY